MPSSVTEMPAEANAAVPRLDPAEVRSRMSSSDVLTPHALGDGEKAPGEPQDPGCSEEARPAPGCVRRRHGRPSGSPKPMPSGFGIILLRLGVGLAAFSPSPSACGVRTSLLLILLRTSAGSSRGTAAFASAGISVTLDGILLPSVKVPVHSIGCEQL
jgi:hypothetical protein